MGREARANPASLVNQQARMARAEWLIEQLGRTAVEAKLHEMDIPDQALIRELLDKRYPVVLQ